MADSTVLTRPTNGVSRGYLHTITADDASNGAIVFDFQGPWPLVASVSYTDASGNKVADAGMQVTYPAAGQVRVAEQGAFSFTATYKIHIVACRTRPLT